MVWGGIFPTVTEAEHGKYWFLPWDYSIEQDADSVAITMTKKDTIDYADRPSRYGYGKTDLEMSVTYTISRTGPAVDMTVELHNPTDRTVQYKYWTCTTLAPGAPSTAGSPTMEIVSPAEQVRRDPAYTWMAEVEEPANPQTPNDRYLNWHNRVVPEDRWPGTCARFLATASLWCRVTTGIDENTEIVPDKRGGKAIHWLCGAEPVVFCLESGSDAGRNDQ